MRNWEKMPYQVQKTPFYRRLVAISRNNGQLQMIKEEYEKMIRLEEEEKAAKVANNNNAEKDNVAEMFTSVGKVHSAENFKTVNMIHSNVSMGQKRRNSDMDINNAAPTSSSAGVYAAKRQRFAEPEDLSMMMDVDTEERQNVIMMDVDPSASQDTIQ